MSGAENEHSIEGEPHLREESFTPDAAEEKAERELAREKLATDPDTERAQHSIFDEPATLPNRSPVLIDRDWTCRNCGYNLRGLMTGHRCPECGCVERYEPPREGEQTYAQWVAQHEGRVSSRKAWLVAALVPILGIPLALFPALVTVEYAWVLTFVVMGPVMSEVLKIAIALTVIERRSALLQRVEQLHLMTLGTALVFAIVQNAVYLLFYFPNAPIELVAYRWSAGVLLHGTCTLIATRGLVPVWEGTQRDHRPAKLSQAYPAITAAVVLHAACNACVFVWGQLGYGF